tara:strand:- start:221 stop:775 length:555 start_codon:yes stop_codon:yes gene_type:complete
MMDKISALAVPPGNSLTDAPGKWPWERPARFSNPDDVIDYTVDSISNGPVREDMIKMMLAGITVEELVEQITFKGFMAGAFTPDVAELVKPAIGIFLADMAIQEGFEPQMFVDEGPIEGNVSDEAFFKIMKEKNPELFRTMLEETNRMQRQFDEMERSELDYAMQKEQKEEDLNNSFMRVEEKS